MAAVPVLTFTSNHSQPVRSDEVAPPLLFTATVRAHQRWLFRTSAISRRMSPESRLVVLPLAGAAAGNPKGAVVSVEVALSVGAPPDQVIFRYTRFCRKFAEAKTHSGAVEETGSWLYAGIGVLYMSVMLLKTVAVPSEGLAAIREALGVAPISA